MWRQQHEAGWGVTTITRWGWQGGKVEEGAAIAVTVRLGRGGGIRKGREGGGDRKRGKGWGDGSSNDKRVRSRGRGCDGGDMICSS